MNPFRFVMSVRGILLEIFFRLVTTEEIWFDDDLENVKTDFIFVRHSLKAVPNTENERVFTLIIDLLAPEDKIWHDIERDARKNIRFAEKNGARFFAAIDVDDEMAVLRRAHDKLRHRKLNSLSPLNMFLLRRLSTSHRLAITRCESAEGELLTIHSYVLWGKRVRALHSISLFKRTDTSSRQSFIGRVNRFHTWRDIQHFRNLGFSIFDLGGYCVDPETQEPGSVAKFKKDFGGSMEVGYNSIVARKSWGRIIKRLFTL